MLKKNYVGIQFKLSVEFKNDRDLPLEDLLALEDSIGSTVRTLVSAETTVLSGVDTEKNGVTSGKEK